MENTALWKQAFVTDPHAVKPITGKQYNGNSPKPYWIIQRATELFGPCGIGWGLSVLEERIERFGEVDSIHIAKVRVWYVHDGKRGEIEQMGQTKMSYKANSGKLILDEDAPKKSVTDAMVKCLSMVGFAGDIFSGRWDDSGYVQWAGQETRRREEDEANAKNAQAYQEVFDKLQAAANGGKETLGAAWKAMSLQERQIFGGSSKLTVFADAVNASKPLPIKMAEAPDLDTLYALADVGRELTEDERKAFEKRQQELEG